MGVKVKGKKKERRFIGRTGYLPRVPVGPGLFRHGYPGAAEHKVPGRAPGRPTAANHAGRKRTGYKAEWAGAVAAKVPGALLTMLDKAKCAPGTWRVRTMDGAKAGSE